MSGKKTKQKTYDTVISLGYNCEVSFRLENFWGKINSMPFSWAYVMKRELFPQALEHIDDLLEQDIQLLPDNMIQCNTFQIKFHPRYDILLADGKMTDESFECALSELCQRVNHLKHKHKELMLSDKRSLFIMKVEDRGEADNIGYIKAVYQVMEKQYRSGNFVLLVVLEKAAVTEGLRNLESDRLKLRSLKKFAPVKHTDIMGDVMGWWKLLGEFTGERPWTYFKRLWRVRCKWIQAVVKKRLGR